MRHKLGRTISNVQLNSTDIDHLRMQSETSNTPRDSRITCDNDDDRTLYFTGDVDETSITQAISRITTLSRQNAKKPITIVFNTRGGCVDDMFALYDMIKFLRTPIYTIGLGKIMSAGVLLLASGSRGCRKIGKRARIMIHPISSVTYGTIFDQKNIVNEMERLQTQWQECMIENTNFTLTQLNAIMSSNVDTYLTPEQAISFGIIDAVLD